MVISIGNTISGENPIEIIFRTDFTDDLTNDIDFKKEVLEGCKSSVDIKWVVGPETFPNLSILWNDCLKRSSGQIIQMGGDDLIYSKESWDRIVVREFKSTFPNGIGFVYGPDGIFYSNLGTHGFVSRLWTDTLGYFTPLQGFTYFNDNWIFEIARKIGKLRYVESLFINHCRYPANHGKDPNYGRMADKHSQDQDRFNSPEMIQARNEAGAKLLNAEIPNYWG